MTLLHCLILLAVAASASLDTPPLVSFGCYVGQEFSIPDVADLTPYIPTFEKHPLFRGNTSSKAIPINCLFNETGCMTMLYTNLSPGLPSKNTFLVKSCVRDCGQFKIDYENEGGTLKKTYDGKETFILIIQRSCCDKNFCNSNGTLEIASSNTTKDENGSNNDHAASSVVLLLAFLAPFLISPSRP